MEIVMYKYELYNEPEDEYESDEGDLFSVQETHEKLTDYYGTAAQAFPQAFMDLAELDDMSPNEIMNTARKNGLF